MRRYVRRNAPNLVLLLILISTVGMLFYKKMIDIEEMRAIQHVDLLTINSIFIGFLFTTLGVLVGFLGNNKIANSDKAGYMDEYYSTIYFGLFFFIVSAICGLISIFINVTVGSSTILLMEQSSIIVGVAFFIKAIINLSTIIKKVRKSL